MTEEKKKRPRARVSKRVSVPRPRPSPEPETEEDTSFHPVFWVECFGCCNQVRQVRDASGRARLPEGWVRIFPTNRTDRSVHPDVYASSHCSERAAKRLALGTGEMEVTILKETEIDYGASV